MMIHYSIALMRGAAAISCCTPAQCCWTGTKLKAVVDLVFGPEALRSTATARAGSTAPPSELWTVPSVRWAAAALLDRYSAAIMSTRMSEGPVKKGIQGVLHEEGGPTGEDVQRWAENFVSSSFGDHLFAAVMAWPLQLWQPAAVQVTLESRVG